MKLLLDTHIWIWSVASPSRLSKRVGAALSSRKNELWLSPVSVWELLILSEKGAIKLDRPVTAWVEAALAAPGTLRDAPLTREIAIESRNVPLSHQDPADRFIAATAIVNGLTLVTADERLLAVPRLLKLACV
ncbi:MAG: type II toxin-antitoxin system VapC family toxin [Thermoanaerobaculia bacterium]